MNNNKINKTLNIKSQTKWVGFQFTFKNSNIFSSSVQKALLEKIHLLKFCNWWIPCYSPDSLSFSQTTSGWWRWLRASPPCCSPSSGSMSTFPSCRPLCSTSWTLLFPTWWACSPKRAQTAPSWSFLRRYSQCVMRRYKINKIYKGDSFN